MSIRILVEATKVPAEYPLATAVHHHLSRYEAAGADASIGARRQQRQRIDYTLIASRLMKGVENVSVKVESTIRRPVFLDFYVADGETRISWCIADDFVEDLAEGAGDTPATVINAAIRALGTCLRYGQ